MPAQGSWGPLIQAQGPAPLVRASLHCWGPEIQRCIGSAFSHINRTGPPTSSFPSTIWLAVASRFTLHPPPTERSSTHHGESCVFLAGIHDALELIAAAFPLSLFAFGIPSTGWISIAGPRHSVDTRQSKLRLTHHCIPPGEPVSPFRKLHRGTLAFLDNAAFRTR